MAVTIAREAFGGWSGTYRIANDLVTARVVADVGPRIVELGSAGGANVLHLRTRELGGCGEGTYRFRGGWRLWVAPERRASTYALDNAACAVTIVDDATLRVSGPPQPAAGVQKHVTIGIDRERPRFRVTSRIVNVGDVPVTYAAWTLAMLRAGGRAFLPMPRGPVEALDSVRRLVLWSYTRIGDARYRFGDRLIEVDHGEVLRGPGPTWHVPERASDESKIGVDGAAGWFAYLVGGTLVVSHAKVEDGPRVDGGATLEAYSNRELIELEHLGPLRTLAAGEALAAEETWTVFDSVTLPPVHDGLDAIDAALVPYVVAALG